MRPDEHSKLFELEDTYWWFVGRRILIRRILERRLPREGNTAILDVGCGTGKNLELLSEFGCAIGADPAQAALEFCQVRGLSSLVGADGQRLPFPDGTFDLVTGFEVLEHIADDRAALAELHRVLKPAGLLFVTVPAYMFLWSEHDEALDHYRRYSGGQLRRGLAEAGFLPVKFGFCITFLFLPILVFRWLQRAVQWIRRRPPASPKTAHILMPRPISAFFVWLLKIEATLLRFCDFPFGVTILCLAKKRMTNDE